MVALSLLIIMSVIAVLVISYWKSMINSLKSRTLLNKIPCFPGTAYPLIGHAHLLRGDPDKFFRFVSDMVTQSIEKLKLRLAVLWLGPVPLVFVMHPESAEVILRSSKHMEKSFVYRFLHPWLGTGLLTSGGEKWKVRRRLLTPSFHFNILQDFLEVMNEQTEVMVTKIGTEFVPDKNVDLAKKVTLCALDIICETAMGQTVNAQENKDSEYVKSLHSLSEIVQLRQKTPYMWSDFSFNRMEVGKDQARALKVLHTFTRNVIEERAKNKEHTEVKRRMAFLDVLLHAKTESGETLSFSDIQEEVDTFMFEGHDTTAAAMTWCLYLLGRHSDVQQRVREELDRVFGDDDRAATFDDLKNLPYLEQVIKESLRLYASVPFFGRVTTEDCVIDGYQVPAGTQVVVMPYSIHRNPSVWSEPNQFDPDRFSTENAAKRHPYSFIPFSAGPRNCIGQKFATMEEKVILSRLLRSYEIRAHDDESSLRIAGDLVLRPSEPLRFTLKNRC